MSASGTENRPNGPVMRLGLAAICGVVAMVLLYLREEQIPEALAGQTAISGIDRHDIIQMAIEPT